MLVLIDNYDSFTYNLVHFLGELGSASEVIRNDKATSDEVLAMKPKAIVLSPGPCTPNEAGVCLDLIEKAAGRVPILGVCLGHQSIGQAYGGNVIRAPLPMHGKTSAVHHDGAGLFEHVAQPLTVARYHSLAISGISDELRVNARSEDGVPMAFQHVRHPLFGVQFHPESFLTQQGFKLVENFLRSGPLKERLA